METKIAKFTEKWLLLEKNWPQIHTGVEILGVFILAWISQKLLKKFILVRINWILSRFESQWLKALIEQHPSQKLAFMAPVLILYQFSDVFGKGKNFVTDLCEVFLLWTVLILIEDFMDAFQKVYSSWPIAKKFPIKGYIQVVKLIFTITALLSTFAIFLHTSPWTFLSGLGAMTAILLLIFKDTILSLVASIQLAYNDSINIGDWIEMPKYDADGDVVDISLHLVSVQNWDKTITNIPAHKFLEESFKNWRGMFDSGGRRICRSILIDVTSIHFLHENEIESLEKITILKEYLQNKKKDIEEHNLRYKIDRTNPANGRQMTNLGTFRAYLVSYLNTHPEIHKNMMRMIRLKHPTESGLPMEVYCFTNTTTWVEYERIQSDIFDHIFAVLPLFGLRVYQNPSGLDIKSVINHNLFANSSRSSESTTSLS